MLFYEFSPILLYAKHSTSMIYSYNSLVNV